MLAAKALTLDEFTRGFAFRYWRKHVCRKNQLDFAGKRPKPSIATIQRIEQDEPDIKKDSLERYAAAMGTTLAEIDALLARLNAAADTGGGTLRPPEIGGIRGVPNERGFTDPAIGESRKKESPAMHSRHVRLLSVELDYMTDAQAEVLLQRLQAMRAEGGRSSPGRSQSHRHR